MHALVQTAATGAGAPTSAVEKELTAVQQKVDAATDKVSNSIQTQNCTVDCYKHLVVTQPPAVHRALLLATPQRVIQVMHGVVVSHVWPGEPLCCKEASCYRLKMSSKRLYAGSTNAFALLLRYSTAITLLQQLPDAVKQHVPEGAVIEQTTRVTTAITGVTGDVSDHVNKILAGDAPTTATTATTASGAGEQRRGSVADMISGIQKQIDGHSTAVATGITKQVSTLTDKVRALYHCLHRLLVLSEGSYGGGSQSNSLDSMSHSLHQVQVL
jgi:hypothetical protein